MPFWVPFSPNYNLAKAVSLTKRVLQFIILKITINCHSSLLAACITWIVAVKLRGIEMLTGRARLRVGCSERAVVVGATVFWTREYAIFLAFEFFNWKRIIGIGETYPRSREPSLSHKDTLSESLSFPHSGPAYGGWIPVFPPTVIGCFFPIQEFFFEFSHNPEIAPYKIRTDWTFY